MTHFRFIVTGILSLSLATSSQADTVISGPLSGAVSGGGGGLTNPSPVAPSTVTEVVKEYPGLILSTWLQAREYDFLKLKPEERSKSPFQKIFDSKGTIYRLVQETSIEARTDSPCLDSAGVPKDGSIFAKAPHVICISVIQIAAKLNHHNVQAETMALIAHEYAHLMGADEKEATLIQQIALNSFSRMEMSYISIELIKLQQRIATEYRFDPRYRTVFWSLAQFADGRVDSISQEDLKEIGSELNDFLTKVTDPAESAHGLQFLPAEFVINLVPKQALFHIAYLYLSAHDESLSVDQRSRFLQALNTFFANGANTITAKRWAQLTSNSTYCLNAPDYCFGPEYDQVVISRPQNVGDARELLVRLNSDLKKARRHFSQIFACGSGNGDLKKNCDEEYNVWPLPEKTKVIEGIYNNAGNTIRCEGKDDGRYLRNTTCDVLDGPGIEIPGSILDDHRIQIFDAHKVLQWDCVGGQTGSTRATSHHHTGAYCTRAWNLDL